MNLTHEDIIIIKSALSEYAMIVTQRKARTQKCKDEKIMSEDWCEERLKTYKTLLDKIEIVYEKVHS